jgi:predicted Fe-S protein YdhL (DUF1289 family)
MKNSEEKVTSPCNSKCQLLSMGVEDTCGTCGRTMAQVEAWPELSRYEKLVILEDIKKRRVATK